MEPDPLLKTGDRILITFEGRTVEGAVGLASPNGTSLIIAFEAVLGNGAGGYAGAMSVSWDETEFIDLVMWRPVTLKKV